MDLLRVIRYNIFTPEENMALDESIAMSVGDGTSPTTLRFYGWKPSAVSIGYFQEVRQEVDLEYCHQHNIDVVRRICTLFAMLANCKNKTSRKGRRL